MTADTQAPVPISLNRTADRMLEIGWSDGQQQRIAILELQRNCPCATCREKRRAEDETVPQLNILKSAPTEAVMVDTMAPVGNYAYSIQFNQGCGKGIFTFELLRSLGELSDAI